MTMPVPAPLGEVVGLALALELVQELDLGVFLSSPFPPSCQDCYLSGFSTRVSTASKTSPGSWTTEMN